MRQLFIHLRDAIILDVVVGLTYYGNQLTPCKIQDCVRLCHTSDYLVTVSCPLNSSPAENAIFPTLSSHHHSLRIVRLLTITTSSTAFPSLPLPRLPPRTCPETQARTLWHSSPAYQTPVVAVVASATCPS